jgi:hypothetical protein
MADLEITDIIDAAAGEEMKPKGKRKKAQPEPVESHKVIGDSKIPVSPAFGKLVESRKKLGMASLSKCRKSWEECIRYYCNDQSSHRSDVGGLDVAGNRAAAERLGEGWSETENLVFATVRASAAQSYSQNPVCEVNTKKGVNEDLAGVCKRLVNMLFNKRCSPGVNLKPKAKRAVLLAQLTNSAWVKLNWTRKDQSQQSAYDELMNLADAYAKAKDQAVLTEIEAKLTALEEKIDLLSPSGPTLKLVNPFMIVRDPTSVEHDLSDCNWLIEFDYLPLDYIRAVYAKKNEQGQDVSVFSPTHILKLGKTSTERDEVDNFSLFSNDPTSKEDFGFDDDKTFDKCKYVRVAYYWDRPTRRIALFLDNDWTWPLWVWDDPLKLDRFYPYYKLALLDNPLGGDGKGEVNYYLDQQDAVNDINSEHRLARLWVTRNLFFNKRSGLKEDDINKMLKSRKIAAIGIDVPEGMDANQMIFTIAPPSLKYAEIFNSDSKRQAINRIAGINEGFAGGQFKTNTTNKAIQSYAAAQNTLTGEKIEAVEDWIADIGWGILQLCLQNYEPEDVAELLGEDVSGIWVQLNPMDIRKSFSFEVVAGSTQKATSEFKQEVALRVGQVLGQFASASPVVVLVLLKMFSRAFNEVVITDEDWNMIISSIQQSQMPPDSQQQANPEEQAKQQAIQAAVERGVPPEQAQALVEQTLRNQQ